MSTGINEVSEVGAGEPEADEKETSQSEAARTGPSSAPRLSTNRGVG